MHKKDKDILEEIKNYFCVGYITQHGKNTLQYRIKSIKDLEVIIEHFDKYPLITQKQGDFLLFKLAFDLVKAKEHLKIKGLNKIVGIRASLNTGINANITEAFPFSLRVACAPKDYSSSSWAAVPIPSGDQVRPLVVDQIVPDPEWFAGFTSFSRREKEACFLVNIKKICVSLMRVSSLMLFYFNSTC